MPKHLPAPFPFPDSDTRPPFDFFYFHATPLARLYVLEEARWRDARDFFLIEAEDAHARIVRFVDDARSTPRRATTSLDKSTALERLAGTAVHAKALAEALGLCPVADPLAPTPSLTAKLRAVLRRLRR